MKIGILPELERITIALSGAGDALIEIVRCDEHSIFRVLEAMCLALVVILSGR